MVTSLPWLYLRLTPEFAWYISKRVGNDIHLEHWFLAPWAYLCSTSLNDWFGLNQWTMILLRLETIFSTNLWYSIYMYTGQQYLRWTILDIFIHINSLTQIMKNIWTCQGFSSNLSNIRCYMYENATYGPSQIPEGLLSRSKLTRASVWSPSWSLRQSSWSSSLLRSSCFPSLQLSNTSFNWATYTSCGKQISTVLFF